MKKFNALKLVFSPDCFKYVVLTVNVMGVCPLFAPQIISILKWFHLYALIVLIIDLFTEQRILRNKGRLLLVIFSLSYCVTLVLNPNLITLSGLSNFVYLFSTLALVYSYGKVSEKADWLGGNIVCLSITVANLIGVVMFFAKSYADMRPYGFVGMYPFENRLCGLFGNPGVLAMISLIGVFLACILGFSNTNKKTDWVYFLLGLINYVSLLLSNSRAGLYCVVFSCFVFTFMWMLKKAKNGKNVLKSILAAVLVAVVVFFVSKATQRGISLFDNKYEYYRENISWEVKETESQETDPQETDPQETDPQETDPQETDPQETDPQETTGNEDIIDKPSTIVREDSGLNGRWELWMIGIELFKAKPIFGMGLDNHNYTLASLGYEPVYVTGNLHNTYLDVLVCCGLVGFLCMVAFLLTMLKEVFCFFKHNDGKTWNKGTAMLASIMGLMLWGMADSTLIASFYPTALAFWLVASQFAGLMESENIKTGHSRPGVLGKLVDLLLKKKNKQ